MTEIWYDEDAEAELVPINTQSSTYHLVRAYVMFLFTWQSLFRVSDSFYFCLLQCYSAC